MKLLKIIYETIKHICTSSLLILIIVILLIFISDYITSSKIKSIIEILSFVLVAIYFIYEDYKDIIDNVFTTYKYIILNDIVALVAITVLCYLQFKRYDDIEALIMRVSRMRWAYLIITSTIFIRGHLKSSKFLKSYKNFL